MINNFCFAKLDINVARDGSFKGAAKSVYMTLTSHADNNTRKCFLKVKTIAKESGYCERTVRNALHKLESWGLIEITEQFIQEGSGRQQINSIYTLIGNEAACYHEYSVGEIPELLDAVIPPCKNCTTPLQKVTGQNESPINNKDSLTREAELPELNSEPVNNPETFTPEDAPDIMKSTAEYLLLKTGRKSLTESEISALRTLSASHYPARIQKEINTACERFKRKNRPLSTLTFNYIAGALANQQSRKPAGKSGRPRVKSQAKSMMMTSEEINSRKKIPDEDLDAEFARLEEIMKSPVKAAQSLRRL